VGRAKLLLSRANRDGRAFDRRIARAKNGYAHLPRIEHIHPSAYKGATMVKVIVRVIVVGLIAVGAAYFFGGTRNFDPTAQGQQAKAAVQPGMTWQQVVDAAGKPQKVRIAHRVTKKIAGEEQEVIEEAAPFRFERELFENTLTGDSKQAGFRFMYNFSGQAAFSVYFDPNGIAEGVSDDKTMADLLDTRR